MKMESDENERGKRDTIWKLPSLPLLFVSRFSSPLPFSYLRFPLFFLSLLFYLLLLSLSAFLGGYFCFHCSILRRLLPSDVPRPCHHFPLSKERKEGPLTAPDFHLVWSALKLLHFYCFFSVSSLFGNSFAYIYLCLLRYFFQHFY